MDEQKNNQAASAKETALKPWASPRLTVLDIKETAGGTFVGLEGSSTHS